MVKDVELTDQEWRERLSPEQYQVLRRGATEPPWSGRYLHVAAPGVFRCAGCGTVLFSTDAKFDSGSGWPSFDRAVAPGTIEEREDRSLGMVRTEITCARSGVISVTSSPTARLRPVCATASTPSPSSSNRAKATLPGRPEPGVFGSEGRSRSYGADLAL